MSVDSLRVGLAQIAPVWLDREATLAKVEGRIREAGQGGCDLVVFGEGLVPGYPFWTERTDGARFESALQKTYHARYLDQAVQIEAGHLDGVVQAAREAGTWVVLGCIERPADRGGHSVYAALVTVSPEQGVVSVHRKLVPTYEERLCWSPGDGHGLVVHRVGPFTLGGLNCWENWMPLARAALHGLGEDLHVALWPGSARNTREITRFLAREGRSFVVCVSGLLPVAAIPDDVPGRKALLAGGEAFFADGGSCVAGPDGEWVVEPLVGEEALVVVDLDQARVRAERQNFDPAGHYSRPDVLRLAVDRTRQRTVVTHDGPAVPPAEGRDDA